MKQQSDLLTAFYRAYLTFAEGGDPGNFTTKCGLCHNLGKFLSSTDQGHLFYDVLSEMVEQFTTAHLDETYPFNNGSGSGYDAEGKSGNMANNQSRLNWVRYRAQ